MQIEFERLMISHFFFAPHSLEHESRIIFSNECVFLFFSSISSNWAWTENDVGSRFWTWVFVAKVTKIDEIARMAAVAKSAKMTTAAKMDKNAKKGKNAEMTKFPKIQKRPK